MFASFTAVVYYEAFYEEYSVREPENDRRVRLEARHEIIFGIFRGNETNSLFVRSNA